MHRVLAPLRTFLRHPEFLVLLGCNLLIGLASSFVAPFFSMFGTIEVGMSPILFGAFMTATALSGIALSTVLARWSDTRLSRRTVLLAGSLTGALSYVGYAYVRDVAWLTVIGCVLGGISSITFSQVFAHARDLLTRSDVRPSDASLYMNVFRLFFSLSWTAGPAMAAWVMLHYRYRGMFLVAAVCFLLCALIVLTLVPETPPSAVAQAAARIPLRRALARTDILAHFIGFALIFASGTMGIMNLPLLVLNVLHGTGQQVGIIYSIAPAFEIPFMLYFGLLATRGDQARMIRLSVVLAVIYYALLGLIRAPWQAYPLQILSAAITAVVGGVAISFFQNFLPEQPGTATNLYSIAGRIGSTAGYLAFGTLAAAFGHRIVFLACTVLCAGALAILIGFRERPPRVAAAGANVATPLPLAGT
ncbi:MAG TPA: sugar efflux transporter [Opitutaceae bacterium]|nr:sugar efflux transporter [Opitutaceae bacterium]